MAKLAEVQEEFDKMLADITEASKSMSGTNLKKLMRKIKDITKDLTKPIDKKDFIIVKGRNFTQYVTEFTDMPNTNALKKILTPEDYANLVHYPKISKMVKSTNSWNKGQMEEEVSQWAHWKCPSSKLLTNNYVEYHLSILGLFIVNNITNLQEQEAEIEECGFKIKFQITSLSHLSGGIKMHVSAKVNDLNEIKFILRTSDHYDNNYTRVGTRLQAELTTRQEKTYRHAMKDLFDFTEVYGGLIASNITEVNY